MRAVLDNIVVRERSDLDPDTAILFIPDTARKFQPTAQPDHLCYAEVVSIGRGSVEQPTIANLNPGDIVMFDLANVSHAFIEDGAGYQVMPQKALCAVMVEGEPRALLDWVITEQDLEASNARISSLIRAPDSILVDGQRTDEIQDGNMRMVFERVVSVGRGRRYAIRDLPRGDVKRLAYDDVRAPDRYTERMAIPECVPGELVAFSPSASTRFRRNGKFYRATPCDEIHGVVE